MASQITRISINPTERVAAAVGVPATHDMRQTEKWNLWLFRRSSGLVVFCLRFALMHHDTVSHAQAHTLTHAKPKHLFYYYIVVLTSACRLKQSRKQNNKIKAKFRGAREREHVASVAFFGSVRFIRTRIFVGSDFVVDHFFSSCAAIRSQSKVDSKSRFKTKQSELTLNTSTGEILNAFFFPFSFKCLPCLWRASHHIRFQLSKIDAAEQAQDDRLVVRGAANILIISNFKSTKNFNLFSIYCSRSIVTEICFFLPPIKIGNIEISAWSVV